MSDGEIVQSVSGISLYNFMLAVREMHGEDVVRRGLARLDPDARIQVEQSNTLQWVPATVLRDVVDAWAIAASVSPEELTDRGVRISTRLTFSTILRAFLHFTSDEAIITRAPLLYARTRNVGKLAAELRSPGVGRVLLTGWRNGTDRQLLSLASSFETVLELTGRKHARCKFRRTSDGGVFDMTWGHPSAPPRKWS